jgi:hypothetical protein
MLSELLRRLSRCETKEVDAFYNYLPRCPNDNCGDCNYSWEIDSTGYYIFGKSSVTYFSLVDGKVFRLVRWYHLNDNTMLKDMMNISKETGQFRVEQFITEDIVNHNGIDYLYTETNRPNNEPGTAFFDVISSSNPEPIIHNFINQFSIVFPHMAELTAKYGCGSMLLSLNMTSQWEQDSLGFYWKNLRLFKTPNDVFINNSFIILKQIIKQLELIYNKKYDKLVRYAEEKWLL